MMYEIDLAWVTANPQAALDMIDRLMRERDDAKALAAASAAGYAAVLARPCGFAVTPADNMSEGYAIVPKVPTTDMIRAAAVADADTANEQHIYSAIWSAMLAATPERPASAAGWRDISTAPRDGSYILALYRSDDERNAHWNGRMFVVRHEGKTVSDFDLGWALFPGYGGVPDHAFVGWMPAPASAIGEVG